MDINLEKDISTDKNIVWRYSQHEIVDGQLRVLYEGKRDGEWYMKWYIFYPEDLKLETFDEHEDDIDGFVDRFKNSIINDDSLKFKNLFGIGNIADLVYATYDEYERGTIKWNWENC